MSKDILGFHIWLGAVVTPFLMERGQGCCSASYNGRGGTAHNTELSGPNVTSVNVEKPYAKGRKNKSRHQ